MPVLEDKGGEEGVGQGVRQKGGGSGRYKERYKEIE